MSCPSIMPPGANKDCSQPAGNLKSFAFTTLDTSFDNLDEAKKTGNWVEAIRSLNAWAAAAYDWENNTSDFTFVEAWDGTKMLGNKPTRGYYVYLKLNPADAENAAKVFNGANNCYAYEVYQNGLLGGKVDKDGVTTGIVANVILEDKGAIKDDLNRYRLHVNFVDDADELTNYGMIFQPNFNVASTFKSYMPSSYQIIPFGSFVTDTVQVQVLQGGSPVNTFVTDDWELVAQDTATPVTITATYVAASNGLYDVVTSAAPASNESISFRINKGTPATTDVSNTLQVITE